MTTQWLRLEDVLVPQTNRKPVQQGWSPKCHDYPATDAAWGVLKTTAIQAGRFEPEHNKMLPDSLLPRPQIEVAAGDLLMTCAGPRSRCGVPTLVRQTRGRLMMSGKMYRFRPDERVDPRFLELWLLSPEAQRRIDAMKTGISDSGLNLTHDRFVKLPVPVPPIDEQRRIIDLLEDHLSRLDATDASLLTASRRASALHWGAVTRAVAEFGGPEVRLGEIAQVKNGIFVSRPGTEVNGVPIIRIGAVRPLALDLSDLRYSGRSAEDLADSDGLLRADDLLFTRYNGNPRFVGACAVVPSGVFPLTYPDKLIRGRIDDPDAIPDFVAMACSVGSARAQIQAAVKTTSGQAGISGKDLKGVRLRLPGRAEQQEAIRAASEVAAGSTRLDQELKAIRSRGAGLRRALLTSAFSGRLTGGVAGLSVDAETIGL